MGNKVELLRDIIDDSKRYEFAEDEVLKISSYFNGNKEVYINFIGLIEVMYEKLDDEDIDRIIWTTDEFEERDRSY